MWQALVAYFVLVAARVALNNRSLRNYLKLPLIEKPAEASSLPSVSVVIPAGNHASKLPALLASLKALAYPKVELLVVEDGWTDSSAEIAANHGATVIRIDTPAEGWKRHPFACWTGAQRATGEWLLFSEATTLHRPDSLERVVRFALERNAEAVSVFLQQRCVTFWERVMLPFAFQQCFVGLPYRRLNDPDDDAALASGHYFLIRREAYFRAGGHEAVRDAKPDELALAVQVKAKGVRLLAARGEHLGSVRLFGGGGEMWDAAGSISSGLLRRRSGGLTALATILSALAIPCAIYGLTAGDRAFELAALVTYVSAVAELSLWQFLFGTGLTYAVFQPLAAVVFLAILLRSAVPSRRVVGKGVPE